MFKHHVFSFYGSVVLVKLSYGFGFSEISLRFAISSRTFNMSRGRLMLSEMS